MTNTTQTPKPAAGKTVELYREGAFSVRPASSGGFAVFFDHGIETRTVPCVVPPFHGQHKHPTYVGQESPHRNGFRTKTSARRFMLAIHQSGLLPTDRPATREDALAVRDWLIREAEAAATEQ